MAEFIIEVLERVRENSKTHCLRVDLVNFKPTTSMSPLCSTTINIDDRIEFQAKFVKTKADTMEYFVKFNKKLPYDELNYHVRHDFNCVSVFGNNSISCNNIVKFPVDNTWQLHKENITINLNNKQIMTFTIDVDVLAKSYETIYEDTNFTNLELRGIDGSVHLNKVVAASCSPFFQALFAGSWRNEAEGVVDVPDISVITLQYLKEYMYLGTMPETDDLRQLLLVASCYMMPDLLRRCVYLLTRNLRPERLIELIEFAVNNRQYALLIAILQTVKYCEVNIDDIPIEQYKI